MVEFRNYLTSANNGSTNAKQFWRLFIEPLEKIHKKDVIKIANVLLERKSTNS